VLIIVRKILCDAGALSVGRPFKCTLRVLLESQVPGQHITSCDIDVVYHTLSGM
jgi:hypothetical protein